MVAADAYMDMNSLWFSYGVVVGRIFRANAAPVGAPWMWTLLFEHQVNRTPKHGYAATREDAMMAFAKSWRRD